jgi:hypothetical protein
MITYSNDKKPDIEVSGNEIRFKWDYQEETREDEFAQSSFWSYHECICLVSDTREEMRDKLLKCGADYSTIDYLTTKHFGEEDDLTRYD